MNGSELGIYLLIAVSVMNILLTLPATMDRLIKILNEDKPAKPDLSKIETVVLESEISRRYGR